METRAVVHKKAIKDSKLEGFLLVNNFFDFDQQRKIKRLLYLKPNLPYVYYYYYIGI